MFFSCVGLFCVFHHDSCTGSSFNFFSALFCMRVSFLVMRSFSNVFIFLLLSVCSVFHHDPAEFHLFTLLSARFCLRVSLLSIPMRDKNVFSVLYLFPNVLSLFVSVYLVYSIMALVSAFFLLRSLSVLRYFFIPSSLKKMECF